MQYVTWKRWASVAGLAVLLAAGCGKDNTPAPLPARATASVKAGVTAADLQAELKVPHLWVTVKGISLKKGVVSLWLHVERAGGLEAVSVNQVNTQLASLELVLRTRDGEPVVLVNRSSGGLIDSSAGSAEELIAVPKDGLDFNIVPFEKGSVERWASQASRPSRLTDGTWLRYYLCTEMDCPSAQFGRLVQVPVVGVGLVRFNE